MHHSITHKRRYKPHSRTKKPPTFKGGMWGHIVKQAIVPFGILAMQQKYKRKKGTFSKKSHSGKTKHRSSTRRRGRR
jgi:hypothetical protein